MEDKNKIEELDYDFLYDSEKIKFIEKLLKEDREKKKEEVWKYQLDLMDISFIEKYLRKIKLDRLK